MTTRRMANLAKATLASAAVMMAGCAIDPYPAEQLAAAEAAIAEARGAGAQELAPGEWRRAQEKMQLGKRWIAAKDFKPALWLVEQAAVDAELATMKAMSARALAKAALAAQELRARNVRVAQTRN
jgi:hypothetical protein